MATKLVLVSILVLQFTTIAFSKHRPHGGHHKQPVVYEPWGPVGRIPSQLKGPARGIPGGPAEGTPSQPGGMARGLPSQPRGPTGGIPTPGTTVQGGGGNRKKWCIGKQNIKKCLLKKDFEDLCKEVDCSATRPKGICYDKSIWSKASYAMNLKYQKNGQKDSDCNHEGRAEIVTTDPSWGKCVLISS